MPPSIRQVRRQRAALHVFPGSAVDRTPQVRRDRVLVRGLLDQGLAVIGERQRNQPSSRQPAPDLTENDGIAQPIGGRRCRVGDRHISVRAAQRVQPLMSVKHGRERMFADKGRPPAIRQWIEGVNIHAERSNPPVVPVVEAAAADDGSGIVRRTYSAISRGRANQALPL